MLSLISLLVAYSLLSYPSLSVWFHLIEMPFPFLISLTSTILLFYILKVSLRFSIIA
jgi:hypothetical protein